MGVFGSSLNTVFLVPTFGSFQFPFFFLAVLVCYGCVSFRPVPVMVVVVVVVVVVFVLDFVAGTGAGGVGAVRGGNRKK